MPRPKYPSDHRRWFRVREDVLDCEKLASVRLSDVGAYLMLLATLNRQKSRDGKARISWRSLAALVRVQSRPDADRVLTRLESARLLVATRSEAGVEYRIDKWLEIQEIAPASLRHDSGATPAPKTTPTPKTKNPPVSPFQGEQKHKAPKAQKTLPPDDLSPEQKVALLTWVRAKRPAEEPRIREHVDACLDHHRSRGNRMMCWVAACQTWIRNAERFRPTHGPRAKQEERAALLAENVQAALRLGEERKQREREAASLDRIDSDVRRLRPVADA